MGLGYIDYKTKVQNDPELQYAMRKKRLAFAKGSFFLTVCSLLLVDTPTANCVFPLLLGCVFTLFKNGT